MRNGRSIVLTLMLTALSICEPVFAGSSEPLSSRPLPMSQLEFVPNKGQIRTSSGKSSNDVLYMASGAGTTCFLTSTSIQYVQAVGTNRHRMDVEFVGANPSPNIEELDTTAGELNYYLDGGRVEGVRAVRKLVYHDLYPHIDLVMYSTGASMKYDLVVHPGGDPKQIVMRYTGAKKITVTKNGDVRAATSLGEIRELRPYTYQTQASQNSEIASDFIRRGNEISFRIGPYDTTRDLVIDPQRIWATYYGGGEYDAGFCICSDSQGNIIMGGQTASPTQIATPGAHNETQASVRDAFFVKFDGNGQRLWATYFGGEAEDRATAVVVGLGDTLYATGNTSSTTGISTTGIHQTVLRGRTDLFLSSFDATGRLVWGTYFGGDVDENSVGANGMVLTSDTTIAVVGQTTSDVGVATFNAHKTFFQRGGTDGFLAVFNTVGALQWATYIGGEGNLDCVYAVAADSMRQSIVIGGITESLTDIATGGAHKPVKGAIDPDGLTDIDGFLMSFGYDGVRKWGTYVGGSRFDAIQCMATTRDGSIYAAGGTGSDEGIATPGAHNETPPAPSRSSTFLVRFNADGSRVWGTYYGGNEDAIICVAALNNTIFIAGKAVSTTGLATPNSYQPQRNGLYSDALLAMWDDRGGLMWGTYYGGENLQSGFATCVGQSGSVYLCGYTNSTNSISTIGSYQETLGANVGGLAGASDAFLVKFCDYVSPVLTLNGRSTLCRGEQITLSVGSFTADPTGYDVQWFDNDVSVDSLNDSLVYTTSSLTPGIHRIRTTITGPNCTVVSDTVVVEVFLPPILTVSNDTTVCGNTSLVLNADAQLGKQPYNYVWTPTANLSGANTENPTALVVESVTYQCIVIDANGCSDTGRVHIEMLPGSSVSITPAGPFTQCGNAPIILRADKGMQQYKWSDGSTADTLVVTTTGLYTVTSTHANGCKALSNAVSVAMFPSPVKPVISMVGAVLMSTPANSYQWSLQGSEIQGATSQTHTPATDGFYTVTIFDANGCPATSDPFNVGVSPRATFSVGVVSPTDPNQSIEIPIVLSISDELDFANAQHYTGTLRYNGTMMLPIGSRGGTIDLPDNAVAGSSDRVVIFEGVRGTIAAGTLQWLQFKTLLGNDTCTALELSDVRFTDAAVDITIENNTFCESGICITDGQVRLIDTDVRLVLRSVQPNPVVDNVEIHYELFENGSTQLLLTDLLGRAVGTLVDEYQQQGHHTAELDVRGMAQGWYRLVLRTSSSLRSQMIIVGDTR